MVGKFEGLEFAACPVRAPEKARVKVGVLQKGALRITFNAAAFADLGKPKAISIDAATRDGRAFLRIKAGADGWPLVARKPPTGEGAPSAACTFHSHPFTPGVVHQAEEVEATWAPGGGHRHARNAGLAGDARAH